MDCRLKVCSSNRKRRLVARVVAIPDADSSPEMLTGIAPGVPPEAQFARRLAENGAQVIVPLIINREDTYSGIPGIGMTNMPHREWIYRMAFEAGRHIIGFEVQKVLAAIDWFGYENAKSQLPVGVIGYGEGGLLALYSGAIDTRIAATVVSGYFQPREAVWQEPIYRDVWGLVREFGDAELASLIAPRSLIVEASKGPEVAGPPPSTDVHKPFACPNGELTTPPIEAVQPEVDRARPFFAKLNAESKLQLIPAEDGQGLPGSEAALTAFLHALGATGRPLQPSQVAPRVSDDYEPALQLRQQLNQLVDFTQALIRKSPDARKDFWKDADASTAQKWKESTKLSS